MQLQQILLLWSECLWPQPTPLPAPPAPIQHSVNDFTVLNEKADIQMIQIVNIALDKVLYTCEKGKGKFLMNYCLLWSVEKIEMMGNCDVLNKVAIG